MSGGKIRAAVVLSAAIILVIFVMASCSAKKREAEAPADAPFVAEAKELAPEAFPEPVVIGDSTPISRALAAKTLAFVYNDAETIDMYAREINFGDCSVSDWYDRYVNACYIGGLMSGADGGFMPEAPLTLGQAQILLDKLSGDAPRLDINPENRDKAISYALWIELFVRTLESGGKTLADYGMERGELIILATADNNKKLKAGFAISADGMVGHSGISLEAYIDKSVGVLLKDGEIIAALELVSDAPTITNAYIVSYSDTIVTIFSGGAERSYYFDGFEPDGSLICDITIRGKRAVKIAAYSETTSGTVKIAASGVIELGDDRELRLAPDAKIYSTSEGAVKWKGLSSIIAGTDITVFVMKDGEVCAAVITGKAVPDRIRVLISATGYDGGYIHDSVAITSDKEFTVRIGTKETKYAAGEVFSLDGTGDPAENFARIYVTPSDGAKLRLVSVKRSWEGNENPKYRGVFEIFRERGGYCVVNELSLEEYLYAVVPSEMPGGHGLEAAKAQAVTARSFAYNQFYQNRYREYGAQVDDSVLCQVYNNIPENELSIKAVDETRGLCLTYRGEVVSANFFSTSAGVTANAGEVWASGKDFPAATPEYLSSVSQLVSGEKPDLRVEENAYAFFKDTSVVSYDSAFSWFRWNVVMSGAELSASVNANLSERHRANPRLIETLQPDGSYKSAPISSIGDVRNIEVLARGEGGNIMTMRISGTLATITVSTEYNIRMLLRPVQYLSGRESVVTRLNGGGSLSDYGLMPSAFFVFDREWDESGSLSKIAFYGGGNGHGVGMSQNGVKGMIDAGMGFEEILKNYYKGTKIEVKYSGSEN